MNDRICKDCNRGKEKCICLSICKGEKYNYPVKGTYWDVIKTKKPDGTVEEVKTEERTNIITIPIRTLMASLFKIAGGYTGVTYHAVGEGAVGWDASPVAPTENDSPLVAESFRKTPDIIDWIDTGTGLVSPTATRIILIQTTFAYGDMNPSGEYVREQGLFGGTATGAADSGEQVDNIRHPKIWKDSNVELVRNIKLEF